MNTLLTLLLDLLINSSWKSSHPSRLASRFFFCLLWNVVPGDALSVPGFSQLALKHERDSTFLCHINGKIDKEKLILIISSAWFFSECYIFSVWLLFDIRPSSNHFGGRNELEVDRHGYGCSFSSYIFNLRSNAKNSALFLWKKVTFSSYRGHRNH